jgi:hypothetical protein
VSKKKPPRPSPSVSPWLYLWAYLGLLAFAAIAIALHEPPDAIIVILAAVSGTFTTWWICTNGHDG